MSVSNAKLFVVFAVVSAFATCLMVAATQSEILGLYGISPETKAFAGPALVAFSIAFWFDWNQCCLGGVIKATRMQGLASIASFGCMILISLPAGYLFGVYLNYGLPGLWVGYGLSSMVLGSLYSKILI